MKKRFVPFLLGILLFPPIVFARFVTREFVDSRFEIRLPHGDRGSIYMMEGHSLVLEPYFANQEYVHICWGKWDFNEKNQILKIKHANRCHILNGTYDVKRLPNALLIRNSEKSFVLRSFVRHTKPMPHARPHR